MENNAARMETAEEAASLDERTRLAWITHPRHRVVDNSTPFDEKVWRVTQEVVEAVGLPTAAVHRRRYIVEAAAAARLVEGLPDNAVKARAVLCSLVPVVHASPAEACFAVKKTGLDFECTGVTQNVSSLLPNTFGERRKHERCNQNTKNKGRRLETVWWCEV